MFHRQWWDHGANGKMTFVPSGKTENRQTMDGSRQRTPWADVGAQTKRPRHCSTVQSESIGSKDRSDGHSAQEQGRRRPDDRQPEDFDVIATCVPTDAFDKGIRPASNPENPGARRSIRP